VLEVFHVAGRHIEAEMQGRGSDHQVFDSDGSAPGRPLALDPSGKLGDFQLLPFWQSYLPLWQIED